MSIGDPTRQAVRERASYLCEYCHIVELYLLLGIPENS